MSAPALVRACASYLRACATGDAQSDVIRALEAFAAGTPGSFVTSWNARVGAVVPLPGDYTAADVGADPAGAAAAAFAAVLASVGVANGIAGLNGAAEISDATHGARSGGALHALATPDPGGVAGFISPADLAKLNAQSEVQSSFFVKSVGAGQSQTTRAPGAVFEGCLFPVPFPATVSTLYGRLTALTTLGAGLRVALYQVPGGQLNGTAQLLASVSVSPTATGAQNLALALGSVSLAPGFAFLLYGRNSATTGLTLRVWSVSTIEGLTSQVPAGQVPACFTTAISSLSAPPSTLDTSTLTPLTNSPAWLGRLALCLSITRTLKYSRSFLRRQSRPGPGLVSLPPACWPRPGKRRSSPTRIPSTKSNC